MNEKLKSMVEKNIFIRIAVAATDKGTQDLAGMQELIALYLGMGWINADEAAEILRYVETRLATVA